MSETATSGFKPSFAIFGQDEITDERRQHWTAEQWGWLLLLKCHMWSQKHHQGKCLFKDETLAVVARRPKKFDATKWREVLAFFKVEGKHLVDRDLLKQLGKMRSYSEKQRDRANRRWEKHREQPAAASAKAAAPPVHQPGDVSPDGKMLWYVDPKSGKGRWMFQTQLEKMKADLLKQLDKAKSSKGTGRLSLNPANETEHTLCEYNSCLSGWLSKIAAQRSAEHRSARNPGLFHSSRTMLGAPCKRTG